MFVGDRTTASISLVGVAAVGTVVHHHCMNVVTLQIYVDLSTGMGDHRRANICQLGK